MTLAHHDRHSQEPRPEGPVAGEGTSSSQAAGEGRGTDGSTAGPVTGTGSSSSQAAGDDPIPAPPAEDASAERGAGEAQVEQDLDALLADVQRERDEYLDLAKRTKADFENYRKRMTAETAATLARGKAEVLRDVLPVLDDLERALQAAGLDPEGDSPEGLAHGVLLVFRSLRDALTRNGVEALDPKGEKFDPNLHEALSTQAADGAEAGTVIETMQKGYRLGEQLIRPARVVVAE
jgi:molecular chaperone GrpE